MKKILIGTTNPAKLARYRDYFKGWEVELYTLADLDITSSPEEAGNTPEENARIKARYYSQFFDTVICGDSGLYFLDYELNDPIQPGLKVRRVNGQELSDEQMLVHYSHLAKQNGGKIAACYVDGIAVYASGQLYSFMEQGLINHYFAFYIHDHIVDDYTPGWPIDALSGDWLYTQTPKIKQAKEAYQKRLIDFLINHLELKEPVK